MNQPFGTLLSLIFCLFTLVHSFEIPTLISRGDIPVGRPGYPHPTGSTPPNGLYYPHEICSSFRAIDIVTDNFTQGIDRLEEKRNVYVKNLWTDKGLALRDWFQQLHRWDDMIKDFIFRLEQTDKWTTEVQVEAASCYAEYWLHTQKTLRLLEVFRYRFPWNGNFICMMYNVISNVHLNYRAMAKRLYVSHRDSTYGLFEGQFPPRYPEWWCFAECGRKPKPKPLGIIAEWAYWHDLPIKRRGPDEHGTFNHTLHEWTCWNRTFVWENKTVQWTGMEDWFGNSLQD